MNIHKEQLRFQILAHTLCDKTSMPPIKVIISPKNNDKYYGEYSYEGNFIRLFSLVTGKQLNSETLREVFYHEFAHYYQNYHFNNLSHNGNFVKTIKYLQSL